MAHHLVATADEDGDGARVLALFDDEHALLRRAERQFAHDAGEAELVGTQFGEARHDATVGGDRDQLR